jgi:hypothetical protein
MAVEGLQDARAVLDYIVSHASPIPDLAYECEQAIRKIDAALASAPTGETWRDGLLYQKYPLPVEHYEREAKNLATMWANGNDGARTCILAALLRAALPSAPGATRSAPVPGASHNNGERLPKSDPAEGGADSQCDNLTFVLNNIELPGQWTEKFEAELAASRAGEKA